MWVASPLAARGWICLSSVFCCVLDFVCIVRKVCGSWIGLRGPAARDWRRTMWVASPLAARGWIFLLSDFCFVLDFVCIVRKVCGGDWFKGPGRQRLATHNFGRQRLATHNFGRQRACGYRR